MRGIGAVFVSLSSLYDRRIVPMGWSLMARRSGRDQAGLRGFGMPLVFWFAGHSVDR
jgi:hypothetical protein